MTAIKHVPKPWGYELIFAHTESLYVVDGELLLTVEDRYERAGTSKA